MERNTRQRQAVLDVIDHAGRALTPSEILALAQASVASLNLSTIYRNLSALQDDERIVKVMLPGQATRFEAACVDAHKGGAHHAHHHHHFHCNACDRVYTLHGCPGPMKDLAPKGFVVNTHEVTLHGLCADCAA
jgi:Fur family ferric uptake transcriptional regulator